MISELSQLITHHIQVWCTYLVLLNLHLVIRI